MRFLVACCVLLLTAPTLPAQAPPPLVVETPPLSPAEQRAKFHLPPGFEIQLVASEPDIGQPMNMNFDARGRLWVTSSVEYPYPVAGEGVEPREERWGKNEQRPPRDWVTVLEGIDDSGKPAKITRFVEGLNIPIGIVPDGDGAIIYSIPNIERFRDTDGDGKADERTKLYGPFGNVDTHGMAASFTRGLDGWIYATHGFRNTTKIQGTDGHVVEMNSGNTFRFKPDGSRVEHWTHGQVNPFGLCFDPWGNLYSADCHSMPLTCLLRGAYYQSFGKPHDGLGFGPDMIDHNHGSTGICGCAWYEAEQFPPEYNGCIVLCNPVTGRVHRDRIDFRGSSPWAVTQPDFITCDDGWFRPVDVKLGPDGALYIADFYNAIIGHYEVPLEHPRRDRTHGRIWRVVYRGDSSVEGRVSSATESPAVMASTHFDLTRLTHEQLIELLGNGNLSVRSLATHEIVGRFAQASMDREHTESICSAAASLASDRRVAHWFWVLSQLQVLPQYVSRFVNPRVAARSRLTATHLVRAVGAQSEMPDFGAGITHRGLSNTPHHVQRAFWESTAVHPRIMGLGLAQRADSELRIFERTDDSFLDHARLLAQRELLSLPEIQDHALQHPQLWRSAALGTTSPAGCAVILAVLHDNSTDHDRVTSLTHIARFGDEQQLRDLIQHCAAEPSEPGSIRERSDIRSIYAGLEARGIRSNRFLTAWSVRVAEGLLEVEANSHLGWTPVAHGPKATAESIFATQTRPFADGQEGALLHSSFPKGETGTGILRSDAFDLPAKFHFFVAGHNGFPTQPATQLNLVRLCDAATGQMLREALPPRNDTAQLVEWDLSDLQGRRGYVEIADGDDRTAYAWLAAGRFSVEGLNPAGESPQQAACELIADLKLTELEPQVAALVRSSETPASLRSAAAGSLLALHSDARRAMLKAAADLQTLSPTLREACYAAIAPSAPDAVSFRVATEIAPLLKQVLQSIPADAQRQLATLLAGDAGGAAALLDLVQQGAASPRLLQDAALVERLRTWNLIGFDDRLAKLTADLPAPDAALLELLQRRREHFRTASRSLQATGSGDASGSLDVAKGQALFKQHCAACHQIGGEGTKIGPQLDGVGLRGPDRLLEDILDPNRNVDAAFRTTVLVLNDGRALTGLLRREEGATLVLADTQGKEFTVPRGDVDQRKDSALSLMPAQLAEKLPGDDLNHLIGYLLSTRAANNAAAAESPQNP